MKVIIPAAGNGTRWNNFRGTQKHLTIVENEILINRTVKQFKVYTNDIIVVSKDKLNIDTSVEIPLDGEWNDAAKLYSSSHIWSSDKTIIAFGDVWFSDEAVNNIVNNTDPIQFFLRPGPSKITGKKHKEIFAMSFNGEQKEFVRNVLEQVISENQNGPGTYLLYKKIRNLESLRAKDHFKDKSNYVEINDWTEDFDYPQDLQRWEKRKSKQNQKFIIS